MQGTQEDDDAEAPTGLRPLGRILCGQKALALAAGLAEVAPAELSFDGRALRHVDAFGAVVLRAAIDAHLARGPGHSVRLMEPEDSGVHVTLHDLLGGLILPSRCSWAGLLPVPGRGDQALVPAGPLTTPKDVDAALEWALPGGLAALGHGQPIARIACEAAAVLLDNAELHGAGAPIFCAHVDAQTCNVQVVVFDGGSLSDDKTARALHDVVGGVRSGDGGLSALTCGRYRGTDFTLRLGWGRERATYRTAEGRWRASYAAGVVPGFVGSVEINR